MEQTPAVSTLWYPMFYRMCSWLTLECSRICEIKILFCMFYHWAGWWNVPLKLLSFSKACLILYKMKWLHITFGGNGKTNQRQIRQECSILCCEYAWECQIWGCRRRIVMWRGQGEANERESSNSIHTKMHYTGTIRQVDRCVGEKWDARLQSNHSNW